MANYCKHPFSEKINFHAISGNEAAWFVGVLQVCICTVALALLLTFAFCAYALPNMALLHTYRNGSLSGFDLVFLTQSEGGHLHPNWVAYGLLFFVICLQGWAALRLVDSTREEILLPIRRNLASFWYQITLAFLIIDCLVCAVISDREIIYFYGAPATLIRVLYLYGVNGHLKVLKLDQPIQQKKDTTESTISDFVKQRFTIVSFIVLTLLALSLFAYKLLNAFDSQVWKF